MYIIHVLGNVYAHTCTVCMHIHGYTCYTVYVCVSCSMLYVVLEAPTSPTSHHKSDSGDHSGNDSGSGSSHSGSSSTVNCSSLGHTIGTSGRCHCAWLCCLQERQTVNVLMSVATIYTCCVDHKQPVCVCYC